jgi:hypothetical protein
MKSGRRTIRRQMLAAALIDPQSPPVFVKFILSDKMLIARLK